MNTCTLTVIFVLLFVAGCGSEMRKLSQEEEARIIVEVLQSFESLVAAAKSLEAEPYFAHFDQDRFTGTADGAVLSSFQELEAMYTQYLPEIETYLSLDFDNVKVTVIDRDAATLVNEFSERIVLTSGDTLSIKGSGLQVWVREASEWKLISVSGSASPVE